MIRYQDGTIEKLTTIANIKTEPAADSNGKTKSSITKDIDIQMGRALSIKRTGRNLAIPGAFFLLAGTVIYTVSLNNQYKPAKQDMEIASYIFFAISVPSIISGSILYGIGQADINTLKKRKAELSIQMVPFDNINSEKIMSSKAISMKIRILF